MVRIASEGRRGVAAALTAALLFGAGTAAAKALLGPVSPWLLAGLLYLGSGLGLAVLRAARRAGPVHLGRGDAGWLLAAVAAGGIAGPVLLLWGLARLPASTAALLLNAEGVFTALLAWFAFRENFDRRVATGMLSISAGAVVLAWPGDKAAVPLLPAVSVLAACFAWAIDNNLTRKVALADATFIAMVKGLAAGTLNVALAATLGASLPPGPILLAAGVVGFLGYGISLVLFVTALRRLGTARTGAYFATAPFAGAFLAIAVLGDPVTLSLAVAAALMAAGVWLHITERHEHRHLHAAETHEHEHSHDEHHAHPHAPEEPRGGRHSHRHVHVPLSHVHPHYPDSHHRHEH